MGGPPNLRCHLAGFAISSLPLLSACAAGSDIEIVSGSVSFQAIPMQQSFCSEPLSCPLVWDTPLDCPLACIPKQLCARVLAADSRVVSIGFRV